MTSSSALHAGRVVLTVLLLLSLWLLARCSPTTQASPSRTSPFASPLAAPLPASNSVAPLGEAYELTDLRFLGTLDWLQQRSTEVVQQ